MSLLFEPLSIRQLQLKNRLVMAPMCTYEATNDGRVTDFHFTHYESRAIGGVGLIIQEATSVVPEGRISANDLGIWEDEQIEGLQKLTTALKKYGTIPGIQLAHAGRKAMVDGQIVAPSAIAFDDESRVPHALSIEEIDEVVVRFKQAAERAIQAGFDVLEIHAAHGYLLHEFLSPLANKRQDEYGGSAENRYRLLGRVIDAIREVWDGVLFVRVSADDYTEGGLVAEDYIPFAEWMKAQDVDLIDVSTGAVVHAKIDAFPLYQVPHAATVRRGGLPVGAVGLITTAEQAEQVLQQQQADVILIGRELLRDPYFAYHAAKQLGHAMTPAVPVYERAWR